MIATRRALAIAIAIAALLGLAVIVDRPHTHGPVDHTLVPGFASARATRLEWRARGAPIVIARVASRSPGSSSGDVWQWADPPGTADPATVGDVLAALRGARWHRRAAREAAGTIATTLTVTTVAGPIAIAIGEPLAGTEQQWLAIGDHALLVDAWVARALAPEPLALRIRAPLANAPSARRIEAGGAVLEGSPRRLVAPIALVIDPALAGAVERALAELVVTDLPAQPVAATGAAITVDDVVVRDAGPCPGAPARRAIDGTHGRGCVDGAAWDAVQRAVAALGQPPERIVDRRPAPIDPVQIPVRIVLADGAVLDLAAHPRVGERDADPVRVAELIAVLGLPGEPVARPASPPTATLAITDRAAQSIVLELFAPGLVARRGEPVALRLGDGAWRLVTRPSRELLDPTPWREEPTTITSVEVDATTYTRGAVLGEWTRTGPGRDDPRAVDRLVAALASPRVVPAPHTATARHIVKLHVAPIGGTAVVHTVELGAPDATGCPAAIGRDRFRLPADGCAAAQQLAP